MSKELWQQAEKPALLLSNICCQVASKFFNSVFVSCLMQTKPPSKKPTVFSLPLPFPKRKKKSGAFYWERLAHIRKVYYYR